MFVCIVVMSPTLKMPHGNSMVSWNLLEGSSERSENVIEGDGRFRVKGTAKVSNQ